MRFGPWLARWRVIGALRPAAEPPRPFFILPRSAWSAPPRAVENHRSSGGLSGRRGAPSRGAVDLGAPAYDRHPADGDADHAETARSRGRADLLASSAPGTAGEGSPRRTAPPEHRTRLHAFVLAATFDPRCSPPWTTNERGWREADGGARLRRRSPPSRGLSRNTSPITNTRSSRWRGITDPAARRLTVSAGDKFPRSTRLHHA